MSLLIEMLSSASYSRKILGRILPIGSQPDFFGENEVLDGSPVLKDLLPSGATILFDLA